MKNKTVTNSTDDIVRNLVLHTHVFKFKKEEISLGMAGRGSRKQARIAEHPGLTEHHSSDEKNPLGILPAHPLPCSGRMNGLEAEPPV